MRWKSWKRSVIALVGCLGISPLLAQTAISTDGTIESKSGGFKFPDGSVQLTAVEVEEDPCANPNDPADEMIMVGGVCIDKYEASIWDELGNQITGQIPCNVNGQDCADEGKKIYARSVASVEPRRNITWFQAQAALANSGKRLPTNAEWQMAVLGTPDPGDNPGPEDCKVTNVPAGPDLTGERMNCVSAWGHYDMVGNLWEWVADWGDLATACTKWSSTYGDDLSCVGLGEGETNSHFPGALIRGGSYENGLTAGAFSVNGKGPPSDTDTVLGFRGAAR